MRTEKGTLILIIVLTLLSCSEKYPQHPNYKLSGEQTGYNSTYDINDELWIQYGLTLKLESKYDELGPINLMYCSWTVYALTDNPEISLGTPCDINTYAWTSINSNEFLQLNTIANSSTPNIAKLRVGFIVIDSAELNLKHFITYPNIDNYLDSLMSQSERVVWSNEIRLTQSGEKSELPWGKWEIKKAFNKR